MYGRRDVIDGLLVCTLFFLFSFFSLSAIFNSIRPLFFFAIFVSFELQNTRRCSEWVALCGNNSTIATPYAPHVHSCASLLNFISFALHVPCKVFRFESDHGRKRSFARIWIVSNWRQHSSWLRICQLIHCKIVNKPKITLHSQSQDPSNNFASIILRRIFSVVDFRWTTFVIL